MSTEASVMILLESEKQVQSGVGKLSVVIIFSDMEMPFPEALQQTPVDSLTRTRASQIHALFS